MSTKIGIDVLNTYYTAHFNSDAVAKLEDDKPDEHMIGNCFVA
jgi:hypothetical protein